MQRYETSEGTGFYYLPEGPVLPEDDEDAAGVFAALMAAIERRRQEDPLAISHLRIEPRWERTPGFLRDYELVPAVDDGFDEPRETSCVDLTLPETGILAQMHPKGRYNIALARRHGVTVTEDVTPRGIADFLDLYHAMVARKGLQGKPDDYFVELVRLLDAHRSG
ncbi:MAG TPA: peptidoglycan bridge formation glycyltransferase FemA/FemB family protein, partial [Gemmatimonadales bacterium]|nr:peptidoglycan bridge formation glycyltransferase FemA/FemB family protein [Gemmatimonadales bacterium]